MSSTIFAINGYPWMTMDIQYIYIEICILFNVLRYNQCVQPLPSFIQLVWLTRGWISHSHELGCRGCDLFGLVPIAIALASGFHSLFKKMWLKEGWRMLKCPQWIPKTSAMGPRFAMLIRT